MKKILFFLLISAVSFAQPSVPTTFSEDGNFYYQLNKNSIEKINLATQQAEEFIDSKNFIPKNEKNPLQIKSFSLLEGQNKVLLFTNSKKVWRYETRGDYWLMDLNSKQLSQLGKTLPEASLMFAKLSPNGKHAAYVSNHNLYVEDLTTNQITPLTSADPSKKLINGTFDWSYEEEFSCLDGFRWSADSKCIAYWQIDANKIKDFVMINNTDSIYSYTIPVEYPKVGESPSSCKVGVVQIDNQKTVWMNLPGDPQQHYVPRMEWSFDSKKLVMQQLNRKQNESKLFYGDPKTGKTTLFHTERDDAWVDVRTQWSLENPNGWQWINNGNDFLWISEKGGWSQIFKVSKDGKKEELITKENYDVISPIAYIKDTELLYFYASPLNSTEKYLYSISVNGTDKAKKVTPDIEEGVNDYVISPNGRFAKHNFSNYYTKPLQEWITLPSHEAIIESDNIKNKIDLNAKAASNVEFISVTTEDNITLEGWMAKPYDFDASKKYPVVFYVYTEPAGQTTLNNYNAGKNHLYVGDMAKDGYIYVSVDGRGSPAPKGREWRKSIYKNIGIINIRDQAMACKKLLATHSYLDPERVAVHGWSGGGSTTLNLLFKYPELYKTGIAIAAVANQLTYDNIYQERYMGVPPEDLKGFIDGSPITNAKNLQGNLLYIHGTADDNVHYQNAELLINELIKHNKQFQFMAYPNRAHGIYKGRGTRKHLNTLFTNYLKEKCPPGAK